MIWKGWEAIEKFTFVLLVFTFFSSASDVYQSYMMRETLVASQRPALYLGLPGGQVADFVTEEGREQVALHFQNYGQSAARNTFIETWPIVFTRGRPRQSQYSPARGRERWSRHPPRFPYCPLSTLPRCDAGRAGGWDKTVGYCWTCPLR
jgi:hypothetical protein